MSIPGEVTDDPEHPPINADQFAKHVAKLHKSDDRGFMIDYNVSCVKTNLVYVHEQGMLVWFCEDAYFRLICRSVRLYVHVCGTSFFKW